MCCGDQNGDISGSQKARINGSELLTKMQFSFCEIQGWFDNERLEEM